MAPKIKNIILFVVLGAVLVAVYLIFIKKDPEEPSLTTTSSTGVVTSANAPIGNVPKADPEIAKDFLGLLLSVKGISLNDGIFSDVAFSKLKDSSILLIQDGNQGRQNPFAPIGNDKIINPIIPSNETSSKNGTPFLETGDTKESTTQLNTNIPSKTNTQSTP
jgi:hypothetical protein